MYNLVNNTTTNTDKYVQVFDEFFPYAKERLGFDLDFTVVFESDPENAKKFFAGTAHYNPETRAITVYIDQRHPKDILRSISHELVHHSQNCRGEFDGGVETAEGYAQNDPHLSKMEDEAYLLGNRLVRDYEDGKKTHNERLYEELVLKLIRRRNGGTSSKT
tara:strand:+ start:854 stop:1339 length:486 start_codon:yes stop_codon:yes gene_type:complete